MVGTNTKFSLQNGAFSGVGGIILALCCWGPLWSLVKSLLTGMGRVVLHWQSVSLSASPDTGSSYRTRQGTSPTCYRDRRPLLTQLCLEL